MNIYKKRTEIINFLIKKYGFKKYLEIGVRNPSDNFNNVNIGIKHGVDPEPKGVVTHKMTSDEFFRRNDSAIYDIIFIDGLHTEEQVSIDINNALNHLSDGGVIVLHDCNPPSKHYIRTHDEYLKNGGGWCGTGFRAFINAKFSLSNYGSYVINEETGIGIISENYNNNNKLEYSVDLLEWDNFNLNRNEILNLISFADFRNM